MKPLALEFTNEISATGLTVDQAVVYECLLRLGAVPASKVVKAIPRPYELSRPLVYKVLDELVQLSLVKKDDEPGKVSSFSALHPNALGELITAKEFLLEKVRSNYASIAGSLTSVFNLVDGKPNVQFFEGMKGVRSILNDALTSKTEICSYIDIATVERIFGNISREFGEEREKRKIKKRNIGVDTPENRDFLRKTGLQLTEERLIKWPTETFASVMFIYDNKIAYMNILEPYISILISDPQIYSMHQALFDSTWHSPATFAG
jgi:sugar-specific transcriptional regulator TrmB